MYKHQKLGFDLETKGCQMISLTTYGIELGHIGYYWTSPRTNSNLRFLTKTQRISPGLRKGIS